MLPGPDILPGNLAVNDIGRPLTWGNRVELRGFEPLTPSMRTRCATGLRYSPWTGVSVANHESASPVHSAPASAATNEERVAPSAGGDLPRVRVTYRGFARDKGPRAGARLVAARGK